MGPNALSSLVDGPHSDSAAAVLSRNNGAWGTQSGGFDDEVRALAAALVGYGLGAGACAAVLGAEGRDTLRAELAVLASGATLVALDPTVTDDALRGALESTASVHAVAEDERQLARVLALRPDLPSLQLLLLMTAAPTERKPAAMLVEAALAVGAANLSDDPTCVRRALAASEIRADCVIAGGGASRRTMRRDALVGLADSFAEALGVARTKTVLVALPVAGVERLAATLAVVSRGATLLLPDPAERPDAGLARHAVDAMLLTVPGVERLHRAWLEDIEAKSWLRRRVIAWALRKGKEAEPRSFKRRLAEFVALRSLREKLGGRVSTLHVMATPRGGAGMHVEAFFASTGLPIRYFDPAKAVPLAR